MVKSRSPFVTTHTPRLIRRKGDEHEAAYLDRLHREPVTTIDFADRDWSRAASETEEAICRGADVVYQAALTDGTWRGFADFIERLQDGHRYEVVDTKLARKAKPTHVLQLCFYTEQLARIQGHWPGEMHVVTRSGSASPSGRTISSPTTGGFGSASSTPSSIGATPTRTRSTSADSATSSRSARLAGPRTTT